ncbi:hypothetical protein Pst134EA_017386 [Puccinia striiformis f. sp. tritici]|nr:hypothetical protein Pst134EA_017386 [Puccinia striiformis f. sp. tritici]KAH9450787.1 hypothetical protein Pst134EB_018299 [Puccinia striiformis f. sp. tritici]KAH9461077.1 hypothetical protein Pst134EA_017386 [Puccinia striiformis f. sp. tritici]
MWSSNPLCCCKSTTLLAAYLMKAYRLTTDDQLEMYERCSFEWNPVKRQKQHRFPMSFVADEIKELILAYYPSPAPSPAEDPSPTMTALKTSSVETKLNGPSLLT